MGFEPKINSKIAYVHRKESFLNNFIFFSNRKKKCSISDDKLVGSRRCDPKSHMYGLQISYFS